MYINEVYHKALNVELGVHAICCFVTGWQESIWLKYYRLIIMVEVRSHLWYTFLNLIIFAYYLVRINTNTRTHKRREVIFRLLKEIAKWELSTVLCVSLI